MYYIHMPVIYKYIIFRQLINGVVFIFFYTFQFSSEAVYVY